MCEKSIEEIVLPMSYMEKATMARCSLCGHGEDTVKMYLDEEHGWVHWKCINSQRRLTRQEQNFEAIMGLVDSDKGELYDDPADYWDAVGDRSRARAIRGRREAIERGDIPEPEED